jgi:hypothetical protein
MSGVDQPGAGSAPLLDADDPALFPKLTEAQVELLAPCDHSCFGNAVHTCS